jgi:ABC-type phosphonate transport system ATPase subunit
VYNSKLAEALPHKLFHRLNACKVEAFAVIHYYIVRIGFAAVNAVMLRLKPGIALTVVGYSNSFKTELLCAFYKLRGLVPPIG